MAVQMTFCWRSAAMASALNPRSCAQHRVGVLAESGRRRAHRARRIRQLDRHAERLQRPDRRVLDHRDHLARVELRIGEQLVEGPHRSARHAGRWSARRSSTAAVAGAADRRRTAAARRSRTRAAGWSRTARLPAAPRRAQNVRHCSSLPTASTNSPSDAVNVSYGTMLGWRLPSRAGTLPVAKIVAGLIGEQRDRGVEHRDVDLLALCRCARARAAPSRCRRPRTCRRRCRRSRRRGGTGGPSAAPVMLIRPPSRLHDRVVPGLLASAARSGRSRRSSSRSSRGYASDSVS